MRGNKGQSPIQYATIILVIVALVGSWMAYANAGTAQGATKKEVESATKGLATKSDLKDLAKESTLKSISKDLLSAIRGKKKITRTDVVGFLSGKSWSDTKTLLDRAGISVPKKKVKEKDVVNFLSGKGWSSAKSILDRAGIEVPKAGKESRFEGIDVIYFPGGPEGGAFSGYCYRGAKAAAEDLGIDLKVFWSDWDPQKMVTQFKKAIGMNPDGIAIMGHPGCDAYRSAVKKAEKKGIIVTSQNVTLTELEKKYKSKGFGYVGQELYPSGYRLGKACVNRFDLGEGDRAFLWGLKAEPARGDRTRGVENALKEAGLKVDYKEISDKVDADPSAGIPVITGYLSKHPKCDLIVTDHGGLTSYLDEYIKKAGLGPDEIYGAGFDLSKPTAEAIEKGYVDVTLDQQPWLQGYLPVLQIALHKYGLFSGLHIKTGAGLVGSWNIDQIMPLIKKGIR